MRLSNVQYNVSHAACNIPPGRCVIVRYGVVLSQSSSCYARLHSVNALQSRAIHQTFAMIVEQNRRLVASGECSLEMACIDLPIERWWTCSFNLLSDTMSHPFPSHVDHQCQKP